MSRSLAEVIADNAAMAPTRPAFLTAEDCRTWADYDADSHWLASVLIDLGLARGERVAVLLPDGPDVHAAYVAAERAGLVAVGIAPRAGTREIAHLLRLTGATALISRHEHRGAVMKEEVARLRADGVPLRSHLVVEETTGSVPDQPARTTTSGTPLEERRLGPRDLFFLNTTSGTTGMPRCVMHDQARWLAFHDFAVEAGELSDADVFMSVVPTSGGFGLWTSHVTPTLLGAPTVLTAHFTAEETLALIARDRVTVLAAVATQFIMMLNSPAMDAHDLASLRVLFTGGEVVPADRAAEFEDRTGACVLQFYGSNETGAVSRTTLRDPRARRLGTAGRVIPAMNVRLFDQQGGDVTASGEGQPGCKGPTLSGGYWGDEAANARLVRPDGWMLLGDVVRVDADGYLQVVGRSDDFIIRGGKNVSAVAVEQEVARHPAVALAAAVAMPDEVFGERVCVYVELRPGAALTLDALTVDLTARGVSTETFPERLVVLDELPRASGGKIAKQALRDDVRRRLAAERDLG